MLGSFRHEELSEFYSPCFGEQDYVPLCPLKFIQQFVDTIVVCEAPHALENNCKRPCWSDAVVLFVVA